MLNHSTTCVQCYYKVNRTLYGTQGRPEDRKKQQICQDFEHYPQQSRTKQLDFGGPLLVVQESCVVQWYTPQSAPGPSIYADGP